MNKNKQYITLEDGTDYRTISKIMTSAGFQMNHATARNVFWVAIKNFLTNMGKNLTDEEVEELLKDEDFHSALSDILFLARESIKEET